MLRTRFTSSSCGVSTRIDLGKEGLPPSRGIIDLGPLHPAGCHTARAGEPAPRDVRVLPRPAANGTSGLRPSRYERHSPRATTTWRTCCTRRSTGCPSASGYPWFSATSKGVPASRRRGIWAGWSERSRAAWLKPGEQVAEKPLELLSNQKQSKRGQGRLARPCARKSDAP